MANMMEINMKNGTKLIAKRLTNDQDHTETILVFVFIWIFPIASLVGWPYRGAKHYCIQNPHQEKCSKVMFCCEPNETPAIKVSGTRQVQK